MSQTTISEIQKKLLGKIESKVPGGRSLTPQFLKKTLSHFDQDGDGVISLQEFLRVADGKIAQDEAEFLFMFWDSAAGQQEPCGMVEVELAVADLLGSMPQYSTLLQGKDLANIAGTNKGNRPSQEGGIFGGGCYAAESEREALKVRQGPAAHNPVVAPPAAVPAAFTKPVNNASSIAGGIFGDGDAPAANMPSGRSNRSNQSSVAGGIFGEDMPARAPPSRSGRNPNASSIEGGIFG